MIASLNIFLTLILPSQIVTIGMPFLKLGVGARPVAMGGAYTAVSDDANAMFWNPGGMGMMGLGIDVSGMLMSIYEGVSYAGGAAVFPVERRGRVSLGLAGSYLSTSDVSRDEEGNQTGEFSIYDALGAAGLGWKVNRYLSMGATAKFIRSRIQNYTSHSLLGDFGLKVAPTKFVFFGLAVQHIGTPRRFIEDIEIAPTTFRGGLALLFPIERSHVLFTTDLVWPIDEAPALAIGAEGKIYIPPSDNVGASGLTVRGGYRSGYHLGDWGGWSLGIGYEYEYTKAIHISLDAVYFSYGLLGGSERLSLGVSFRPN